jgi:hypothetical protein
MKACPFCTAVIPGSALICEKCQRDLAPLTGGAAPASGPVVAVSDRWERKPFMALFVLLMVVLSLTLIGQMMIARTVGPGTPLEGARHLAGARGYAPPQAGSAAQVRSGRTAATPRLEILTWEWGEDGAQVTASGRVKNVSSENVLNAQPVLTFSTADGRFVWSTEGLMDQELLLPGHTSAFRVSASASPLHGPGREGPKKAAITFKTLGGGEIPSVRLDAPAHIGPIAASTKPN